MQLNDIFQLGRTAFDLSRRVFVRLVNLSGIERANQIESVYVVVPWKLSRRLLV